MSEIIAFAMILCYNEQKHFARGNTMVISYKKLWKLLIDRDMKKKDLIAKSGISQSSVTKLGHNESVSTDIIVKICTALECDLTDIMELVPEEK